MTANERKIAEVIRLLQKGIDTLDARIDSLTGSYCNCPNCVKDHSLDPKIEPNFMWADSDIATKQLAQEPQEGQS